MAPPGAHSAPSTSTPLFISIVIVVSSVVVTSSVLLIVVLVVLLRRRVTQPPTQGRSSIKPGNLPKLVITDTSMIPASSVVVKNSDDLDKVIASFKPLRSETVESEECKSGRPSKKRQHRQEIKLDSHVLANCSSTSAFLRDSSEQVCENKRMESASPCILNDDVSFRPPGIWWYEFNGSEISLASTSSGETDNLPATPDSKYSLSRASIMNDSSLSFDRDILEYCWRLSDKNILPAQTIASERIIPEAQTLFTKPETSVSMKMLSSFKSSASLDKQILEYCWRLSDHGSLDNMQEDLDNTSVSIKFTSAAKSVSEASVVSLEDIQDHDSGQIVVRCSKARMAQARTLTSAQKALLRQCKISLFSELILIPPSDLSRKTRRPISEIEELIENACKEYTSTSCVFTRLEDVVAHKFTTGDAQLDHILGGGIKTGMLWEITGESASGKSQLALQLSLLVQLRPLLGGLSGSACYITTYSKLATKRLGQLIEEHPLLSPSVCSLSDIHTAFAPNVELLLRALKQDIPTLQKRLAQDVSRKPIRLVIVDSLSSIFQTNDKPPASALFERSKSLTELSFIMHNIAARDDIAFLIVNDVSDYFAENPVTSNVPGGDVIYRNQARWFNSAHSFPGENAKEASLGLVWANQVNVRIMLSRTQRKRHLEASKQVTLGKRRRMDDVPSPPNLSISVDDIAIFAPTDQPVLLRRLTVIYSSVAPPNSIDFVITKAGISAIAEEGHQSNLINSDTHHLDTLSTSAPPRKESLQQTNSNRQLQINELPLGSAQFTSALSVEMDKSLDSSTDSQAVAEVIPSTFPEEEDVLGIDDAYWEEFDEVIDPLISCSDPEASDNFYNLGIGTSIR